GEAPAICVRKPKRRRSWSDHRTPTDPSGRAVIAATSSGSTPEARVTGPENESYGGSAYRTWTAVPASAATQRRAAPSRARVAVSLLGNETVIASVRPDHGT